MLVVSSILVKEFKFSTPRDIWRALTKNVFL